MSLFTTCIITVSSQAQAVQFEKRIQRRIGHGLYPREISFRVYSDPSDMPAGSGGGTLYALSRFFDESGWKGAPEDFFADRKILLIHAAGKNRGVPSFVPENRLFIPLPLDSSSIFPPVVLDTHLSLFLRYPWRKGEVVVTAGDAVIDFETGLIPEIDRGDMCGFAASGTPVQGSRHGVYKFDHYRRDVVNYYQKADVRELRNNALIEGTGECALDMGILALSPRAAASFVTLGKKWDDSGRIASFDLYLEVITAALYGMTPEEFDRRTAARTGLTAEKRKSIFETFNRFTLRAMLARHASFYHTGTFKGYMETCTRLSAGDIRLFYNDAYDEVRAINSPDRIIFNSIHCDIPIGSRKPLICESVENSTVENPLGSNIFHGLSRFSSDEVFQPGICLEERSVDNLRIRIVYSQADLFNRGERLSDVQFCGLPMDVWLAQHKLRPEDIGGDGSVIDLYTARLFFDCPAVLLPGYWQPQSTEEWTAKFRTARRYSLEELDRLCTLDCKEERRIAIRTLLLREQITGGRGWVSISQPDFKTVFASGTPLEHLTKMCDTTDDVLLRRYRKELLDSVSQGCDIASAPVSVRLSRSEISGLFGCEGKPVKRAIQESERVMIRCPVRMDIAGGWSDTAPYALQYGGAAVNCAIDINGKKPVEVTCRAITEPKIVFRFSSIPEPWVIDSFEDLEKKQEVKAFAFCREMLRISGLAIPHDRPFSEILKQAGGGFEIVTECGIAPDGLGVSSVQMVSVLASCARFYGVTLDFQALALTTLEIERRISGGGGWQDITGACAAGIKYIRSERGIVPHPVIRYLDPFLFTGAKKDFFTLFYTGINRRSGRMLQDVISRMYMNIPAYKFTMSVIRDLAAEARDTVSSHDIGGLADVLNRSRRANELVHQDSKNRDLDDLFEKASPYYCGVKMLGAGGAGYALFCSDSLSSAEKLREFLTKHFAHGSASVADFSLDMDGLSVEIL